MIRRMEIEMEAISSGSDVLGKFSDQLADAVEQAERSIVLVNGRERQADSGLVFGSDLILTAAHVLEREDPAIETHDGKTLQGKVTAHDPGSDLALIKVEGLGLQPAKVAATAAKLGQYVLAVGRPASGQPMAR